MKVTTPAVLLVLTLAPCCVQKAGAYCFSPSPDPADIVCSDAIESTLRALAPKSDPFRSLELSDPSPKALRGRVKFESRQALGEWIVHRSQEGLLDLAFCNYGRYIVPFLSETDCRAPITPGGEWIRRDYGKENIERVDCSRSHVIPSGIVCITSEKSGRVGNTVFILKAEDTAVKGSPFALATLDGHTRLIYRGAGGAQPGDDFAKLERKGALLDDSDINDGFLQARRLSRERREKEAIRKALGPCAETSACRFDSR